MSIQSGKLRERTDFALNASKRHKEVGKILSNSIFRSMTVYQEYPVSLLNPSCENNKLKIDWYIKDLNIAIEVQGEHHYEPVTYGGKTLSDAKLSFRNQSYRDSDKARLLEEVGCNLIELHYNDDISEETLMQRISDVSKQEVQVRISKPKRTSSWRQPTEEQKEKARQIRRERYRQSRRSNSSTSRRDRIKESS